MIKQMMSHFKKFAINGNKFYPLKITCVSSEVEKRRTFKKTNFSSSVRFSIDFSVSPIY